MESRLILVNKKIIENFNLQTPQDYFFLRVFKPNFSENMPFKKIGFIFYDERNSDLDSRMQEILSCQFV